MNGAQRPRLGELLVERGLLTQERLDQALAEQSASGLPLGNILVRDGLVASHTIAMALADQQGAPVKSEFGYATGHGSAAPSAPVISRAELDEARADAAAARAQLDELRDQLARLRRAYSPDRHVLCLPGGGGYELLERRGPAPEQGSTVELSGDLRFTVSRVGPSPFPGASEACAYLEPLH